MRAALTRVRQYLFGAPALISLALIVLMGTTGVLAARVRLLRERVATLMAAERTRTGLPLGTAIPSFAAYALDGTSVRVAFDETGPDLNTLFFVYSPECGICDATWPQWMYVRQSADATSTRQIFVDLTATTNADYLARWELASPQVITHMPVVAALRLRISVTPQVILTNKLGKVTGVWAGRLDDTELNELIRAVGANSSNRPQ